jgi:hypothetical protein
MDLHLGHELLLLHLDDADGKGKLPESLLSAAYGGAVLAQWLFDGQLVEGSPKEIGGRTVRCYLLRDRESRWDSLKAAEAVMPTHAEPMARLLEALQGWRASNRYAPALKELQACGCVEPVKDGQVERALIHRLRAHVDAVAGDTPTGPNDALLGILHGVGLLGAVWSDDELEAVKGRILARADKVVVGPEVRKVVRLERMLSGGMPKL